MAIARSVVERAHAPYSRFPVAAAVLTSDGGVFTGVNVENASYGLTMCAERVAIFSAIAAGASRVESVAVHTPRLRPVMPCGACRQVMSEFMDASGSVYLEGPRGDIVEVRVGELLPGAFSRRELSDGRVGRDPA